ncbi:MAG: dihydropteroate synthase [Actinomycetota bacterium]
MPAVDGPIAWRCGGTTLACGERTLVMGVLNVTPDSFSDGGRHLAAADAIEAGRRMVGDGADVLDVGGESTRPGAEPVDEAEECRRVLPVVEGLAGLGVPISIDTTKPGVARAATAAGASIVNDVSGARDPEMLDVVRETGAGLVLMHMRGDPRTMQDAPTYGDVVAEVKEYLRERVETAVFAGVAPEQLAIDPGIGFGKDLDHNLRLLRCLGAFADLRRPVLVGPSRKRFIGAILGDLPVGERLEGTAGAVAWLAAIGADVVRVHDVREMVRVVRVVDAIARAGA